MSQIKHSTGHIAVTPKLSLYYQDWRVHEPKAVLLFILGLNDHLGRYKDVTHYFAHRGFTVYIYDHRGHGKSGGSPSYVDRFEDFVEDLKKVLAFVQDKEKGQKLFLVGHSMGGQTVLNYGLGHPSRNGHAVQGIVALSPNLEVALKLSFLKYHGGKLLSKIAPHFEVNSEIPPSAVSRDPEVVRAYATDPLVPTKLAIRLGAEVVMNQEWLREQGRGWDFPVLMMHGEADQICTCTATKNFFEKLPIKDKTLKIYPGAYHELWNDYGKEEVLKDLGDWLETHL